MLLGIKKIKGCCGYLKGKLYNLAKPLSSYALPIACITFLLLPDFMMAAGKATNSISTIAANMGNTMKAVAGILEDISLVAGIGFVMASFFKFHQHKLNPQQVPISQGITLLLVGGGLTVFPALIPVAGHAVVGSDAKFGSLTDKTGTNITDLLNNN